MKLSSCDCGRKTGSVESDVEVDRIAGGLFRLEGVCKFLQRLGMVMGTLSRKSLQCRNGVGFEIRIVRLNRMWTGMMSKRTGKWGGCYFQ